MNGARRVSLGASRFQPHNLVAAERPRPLLHPDGARIILGNVPGRISPATPIAPGRNTLFGPRGVCLAAPDGPLIVSDTGHHRVLIWRHLPAHDAAPADRVIGQPGFEVEGRNAGTEPGAATLNVPTCVAYGAGVLAVADAWNHRVLLWHGLPDHDARPADIVLGQADFAGGLANRGATEPRADTLHWCYGIAIADNRLIVADTGNRRVLVWETLPVRNGAAADLVLGQADFTTRDEGGGMPLGSAGMRWPHAVLATDGAVFVADAGASRVMVWRDLPTRDGAPCDVVLGQPNFAGGDHNRGAWAAGAATLNMPYGIARLGERLVLADTANSRLLGFPLESLAMGGSADTLAGQQDFALRGDNRWRFAARDSVNWPYGIGCCDSVAIIADSGNDRVLIWEAA